MSAVADSVLQKLLDALAAEPRTALALKRVLSCSKPTAYKRLAELRKRGVRVRFKRVREGRCGPPSRAFYVETGTTL